MVFCQIWLVLGQNCLEQNFSSAAHAVFFESLGTEGYNVHLGTEEHCE